MIRAVAKKRLDLSDDEYEYFLSLKASFEESALDNLFQVNDGGIITSINLSPDKPVSIVLVFFLLNVMTNQRFRSIDMGIEKLKEIENRLQKIEEIQDELVQR